ncbi:MAG: hypothetical protein RJA76_1374 [Bacteroidota bacterium]|jgi:uncharacterized protein (TIGR00369 family)
MNANSTLLAFLNQNIGKKFSEGNPNPITTWLDGTLLAAEKGTITAEFEVRPDQLNHAGVMHGGIITTILDEMMGVTLITYEIEHLYVTINLHVDFLFGARVGEKLKAVSEVFRVGKKIANVEAKLYNEKGQLIAKGTSNLAATSVKVNN